MNKIISILLILTLIFIGGQVARAQQPDANGDADDIEETDPFFEAVNKVFFSFLAFDSNSAKYWLDVANKNVESDTHRAVLKCLRIDGQMLLNGKFEGFGPALDDAIEKYKNGDSRLSKYLYSITLISKGFYLLLATGNNEAETMFRKAAQEAEKVGAQRLYNYARILQAETLIRKMNYVDAIYYARKIDTSKTNDIVQFQSFIMLFKAYTQLNVFEMAERYRQLLEEHQLRYQSTALNVQYQLRCTEYLLQMGDLRRARKVSDAIIVDVNYMGFPIFIPAVNLQRAKILALQNENEEAEKLLVEYSKSVNNLGYFISDVNYCVENKQLIEAIIAVNRKQYLPAKRILDGIYLNRELRGYKHFIELYFKAYQDVYCALGDYSAANATIERFMHVSDSISEIHGRQWLQDMATVFQTDTTIIRQRSLIYKQRADVEDMHRRTAEMVVFSVSIILALILLIAVHKRRADLKRELQEVQDNEHLKLEVDRQTADMRQNNQLIRHRNDEIETSNRYALFIQQSVFPSEQQLQQLFPRGAFLVNLPNDAVSGNFGWYKKIGSKIFLFSCSSSESGVPGAMISMVLITLISDEVAQHPDASAAEYWAKLQKRTAYLTDSAYNCHIDLSIAILDTDAHRLNVASAQPNVVITSNGNYKYYYNINNEIVNDVFADVNEGDVLYLFNKACNQFFSADGNDESENEQFVNLLLGVEKSSINERKDLLQKTINEWHRDINNGLLIMSVTI